MIRRTLISFSLMLALYFTANSQILERDSLINFLEGTWRWETYRGGIAGLPPAPALFNLYLVLDADSADYANGKISFEAYSDTALEAQGKFGVEIDTSAFWMPYELAPGLLQIALGINDSMPVNFEILDHDLLEFTHKLIADDFFYAFRRDSTFIPPGTSSTIDSVKNILNGLWRWTTSFGGFIGHTIPADYNARVYFDEGPGDSIMIQLFEYDSFSYSSNSLFTMPISNQNRYCLNPGIKDFKFWPAVPIGTTCIYFLGTDSFSTITTVGDGYDYMFVRDTSAFVSEVWPGDANNDGVADNNDILALGLGYGSQGPIRPNASIIWTGQNAADWNDSIPNGNDKKYSDCNGDGDIDRSDTTTISLNYQLTHNKSSSSGRRFVDPILSINILNDTLKPGDTLQATINLGDISLPASDVYGLAYSINYNPSYVNDSTVSVDFNNSWIAPPSNTISLVKSFSPNGRIDVGYSRIDQANVSGYGTIGSVSYVIIDNVDGKNTIAIDHIIGITNVLAISNDGTPIDVAIKADTVVLNEISSSLPQPIELDIIIRVLPNQIQIDLKDVQANRTSLTDVIGKEISNMENPGNAFQINTLGFPSGIYFLSIETNKGISTKKIYLKQ